MLAKGLARKNLPRTPISIEQIISTKTRWIALLCRFCLNYFITFVPGPSRAGDKRVLKVPLTTNQPVSEEFCNSMLQSIASWPVKKGNELE